MRVLHLGKLCPPHEGGIELFSYDLLEYLNKNGIKADLLCFGDCTNELYLKSFKCLSSKLNFKMNSALISYDYVKIFKKIEQNYDIIHIHSPNPLAEILVLTTKKKVIIHWHSDIVKQKILYKFYKPFQNLVLKKANIIICTSPQYLESSKQLHNYKAKSVVIPLGLNINRLSNSNYENCRYNEIKPNLQDKKVVISIGRFVEYKGFEYLIESAKYLNENIKIIIVGTGPIYKKLNKKVIEMNLKEKVFLPGRIDNISLFIKNSDLVCLPSVSRNEAFGLVLVEALFFGKPLITTNIVGSGVNYVNKNNITGLIVPPKDPVSLANSINKLLSDKKIYETLSKNAQERFKEFEISLIGSKIINIYKEIINQ